MQKILQTHVAEVSRRLKADAGLAPHVARVREVPLPTGSLIEVELGSGNEEATAARVRRIAELIHDKPFSLDQRFIHPKAPATGTFVVGQVAGKTVSISIRVQ